MPPPILGVLASVFDTEDIVVNLASSALEVARLQTSLGEDYVGVRKPLPHYLRSHLLYRLPVTD